MTSSRSDSIALALLAILLVALICLVRTSGSPGQTAQAGTAPSPVLVGQQSRAEIIAALEAKIAQLTAEKEDLQNELRASVLPRMAFASRPISLEDFSSGDVVFAGLVERAENGTPHMIAIWKGRPPSDFGDYINGSVGKGSWLIGRMGNNILRERDSTRFCYPVTPEGRVEGIAQNSRVEFELPPEDSIEDPNVLHLPRFKAPALCPPMELAELRKYFGNGPAKE